VQASSAILAIMVVVDVGVANLWTATLLWFAGREGAMDARLGADRSRIDEVRERIATFRAEVARPVNLPDMLTILALGLAAPASRPGSRRICRTSAPSSTASPGWSAW